MLTALAKTLQVRLVLGTQEHLTVPLVVLLVCDKSA